MSSSSNLHLLTHSHSLIASKKRAKRTQVKQVIFDEDARREFLTGFHKRKVAKAEAARKKAAEREKRERLQTKKEQRRMLKEQAAENAAQVERAYGAIISDDETEWHGIQDSDQKEQEHEFGDQEVVATVAVVEDFDPDSLLHGSNDTHNHGSSSRPKQSPPSVPAPPAIKRDSTKKAKLKPKKIRYETKEARKAERSKQRARRTEKAELAGGKAARNKGKKRR
ncbi:protein required for cell viability rrp17 [Moniliophthora roreri MCA 2997]|uniref:Protein required for cell viability rrp17 n=2 Tax=Moniliophthora roreri TaxID=221103 RepID=V2XD90_MONRO|nr:protein required for cell viability rrp17 [Moniliophthora roreri MCA 2997]KAI3619018.1 protein required for cell viability rrp17 [Moniliophthora roreri]